jgi:alpha-amylase/alpha-mannosidase (GH57 family)
VSALGVRPLVVVHGHLYQPPREDPRTGTVPVEASAAPFHDWNERITDECYRANAHARLGEASVSNYERLSYNACPTLTTWFAEHAPDVLGALADADARQQARGQHGPALAAPWVHAILPLCSPADRATMVQWGIAEFTHRFGRTPDGMWLPETALDTATLVALADAGIGFTIVAPHQVAAHRHEPGARWAPGAGDGRPLRVALPGGRAIVVLPYDGECSNDVAFNGALHDGVGFARRLVARAHERGVCTVVTDMESYGHHHRFGEMALAAAFEHLAADPSVEIVNAADAVARLPHGEGVVVAPSAWSCAHGVERWHSDCGCRAGAPTPHGQSWRAPLRSALDTLRDAVAQLPALASDLRDPARARDEYVAVLLDAEGHDEFVRRRAPGDAARARQWLQLQYHLLLMYSSCAWFFDDAAGHESLIVLRHAAAAIDLVADLGGPDLERAVVDRLAPMVSDVHAIGGAAIWHDLVRSA